MTRRLRLWVCPCCHRAWRRYLTDAYPPICGRCSQRARVARKWPKAKRCRHDSAAAKLEAWKERYWSVPRRQSGRRLTLTPELRVAWRACRQAKTRPNLERKAAAFVALLIQHGSDAMDGDRVVRWSRKLRLTPDKRSVVVDKSAGGWVVPSTVTMRENALGPSTYGNFAMGIGCRLPGITIDLRRDLHPNVTEIRATLVHEALHALDAQAGLHGSGHDLLWRRRLLRMYRLFPPTPLGVVPAAADLERWR